MTVAIPDRSFDQRMAALESANRIRSKRAELKRRARVNPLLVPGTILNPPDWVLTMRVEELLLTIPRIGRVKARKILRTIDISQSKTVGGLSDRQRRMLVRDLRGRLS